MQIFGQVWLWSLGSFLLGAFFTWLLLVRPMRKRLLEVLDNSQAQTELVPTQIAEPVGPGMAPSPGPGPGPGPNAADKFLDDLFETQKRAVPPFPSVSPPPAPAPAPLPAAAPLPVRPVAAPQAAVPPQPAPEPVQSRPAPEPEVEDDTELSDNPFRRFAESTTVFVPPSNLPVPPDAEGSGEDWFAKEDDDPQSITDVEDDEVVDDSGTIFTQHTTPIPADVIRALDESQPPPAAPEQTPAELTQTMPPPARHGYDDHDDEDFEPAAEHLQELSAPAEQPPMVYAGESFVAHEYEPERPAQARREVTPETEMGRSLFEPVVPVPEQDGASEDGEFVPPGPFGPGSAMPLPGGGSPAPEFNVKASVTALRYCTQDNPQFDRIVAEVWFRTPSDAERVGFRVLS